MTTTTTATIKRFYDHEQASKDLREYNPDLQVEFLRQPGLYAYYNSLLVQAELQLSVIQHRLKLLESHVAKELRKEAKAAGDKLTEAQKEEQVALDARVRQMTSMLFEAKAEVGYLKGTVIAFAQRKDMLRDLGWSAREEVKGSSGNMVVMKSSVKENQRVRLEKLSTDLDFDDSESYVEE